MSLQTIPTRRAVMGLWETYQALAKLMREDPLLRDDPASMIALQNAQRRFEQAFSRWSGE